MGRYTGNVVTETNAFVSQESNTVDPNSDKNPLLDNSDPTEGAEPDREHGDDFQVAGEDLVEKKNVTENDVFQDGEVLNKINEIDNIAKEGQENADAVEALAAVSCEMHAILADRGHLTAGEAMVLRGLVASVESAIPELATVETAMPSMEDFKLPGLEYSNANVSMESISEKINLALNKVETNMVRLFKNGIGLANSMTPLIDAQISRCATVKGSLNGARRDDGQKEVSGGFVKNLSVDGATPDANTVIKVAKYLEQCNGEIMSPRAMEEAKQLINQLQQTVRNGVDGDVIKSPSILLRTLIVLTAAGYAGIKGAKAGFAAGAVTGNPGVAVVAGAAGAVAGGWTTTIAGVLIAKNNMDKIVNKQIKIDGSVAPELFKLYPSIAKVNFAAAPQLEGRHSLPLFGNRVINVTQYAKEIDITAYQRVVPSIELAKGGKKAEGKTMQSLNPSQQAEVLASAERLLITARNFYKDYATRNRQAMEVSQKTAKLIADVNKNTSSITQRAVQNAFLSTMNWYSKMFWSGIFADQHKLANYTRTSAKALIDLVVASSAGAQGGEETASTEAFADFL